MRTFLAVCVVLAALCSTVTALAGEKEMAPVVSNSNVQLTKSADLDAIRSEIASLESMIASWKAAGQEPELSVLNRLVDLGTLLGEPLKPAGRVTMDQAGETCAAATVIPGFPFSDAGVLGQTDDCVGRPYFDAFYVFTCVTPGIYSVDMCGSVGDQYLKIWTAGTCCSGASLTADDECLGDSVQTNDPMRTVTLTAGQVIYFEIGGYYAGGGAGLPYVFDFDGPCNLSCSGSETPEGEPDCYAGYVDTYNGGCNSTPNVFLPIACGQAYCGRSGTWTVATTNYRDTDWYELILTDRDSVRFTVNAEFPVRITIYRPPCPGTSVATVLGNPCTPTTLAACLLPGTYWLFVAPDVFTGVACGSEYTALLECLDCWRPPVCDCVQLPNTFCNRVGGPLLDTPNPAAQFPINVTADALITDVNVCLNAVHTFDGDLKFWLMSPAGTVDSLILRRGSSGDNFLCTILDDEATIPIISGVAPFTGSFIPEFPLSVFDGQNALGTWTLFVQDFAGGDVGYLFEVCLTFELVPPCEFHSNDMDMGDLATCNYPTEPCNPSHELTGVAWLGYGVTGELIPNQLDVDPLDDGVVFVGPFPWVKCDVHQVTVVVTAGPNYQLYEECGGHLFLSAWKDGNLDGDFCDVLPCGAAAAAPEWIIQDAPVVPGVFTFSFLDPGVPSEGTYPGIFRFRLLSGPQGPFGCGQIIAGDSLCPNLPCGTFAHDSIGEVEDYIIPDLQLFVELSSFTATASAEEVVLSWVTASESNNDHFELVRDGSVLASVATLGNDATGHAYSYVDRDVLAGTTYRYTLVAVDVNGGREELRTVSASTPSRVEVVTEYALHQNYPNPFNPTTNITFDLVESGFVSLKVYNLMGQDVATVVNGTVDAGRHIVSFNAANLSSGVYLYRLAVNGFAAEKKMLLMK